LERDIEAGFRVEAVEQSVTQGYDRSAMRLQKGVVACSLYVFRRRNNRSYCLIQLKSILENYAINEPAMYSGVPQLRRESVLQCFTR
jgi:hypothetical protein